MKRLTALLLPPVSTLKSAIEVEMLQLAFRTEGGGDEKIVVLRRRYGQLLPTKISDRRLGADLSSFIHATSFVILLTNEHDRSPLGIPHGD